MLTLYYVSATFLQSWRISKICQKITEQLASQASVAFYALPTASDDGFDASMATSELCVNRQVAKVSEILWLHGNYRGSCVMPLQNLQTSPWISFPEAPALQPFAFNEPSETLLQSLSLDKHGLIRLLIETEIQPSYNNVEQHDIVKLENYGKLLAWKIDSHLAVLIETNIEYFTKLLIDTFLQNHFLINDELPLLRIESVKNDGAPQPYDKLSKHLRKPVRNNQNLTADEWSKHLEDLRALSVLANQAIEYAYNKNKTEGKTSISKPDLIPHEKRTASAVDTKKAKDSSKKTESPKKLQQDVKKDESLERSMKEMTVKLNPEKTKVSKDTDKFIKSEQLATAAQPAGSVSTTAAATSAVDNTNSYSSKSHPSPSKNKAKPTEIKKPSVVETGRIKTSSAADLSPEVSELEKMAGALKAKGLDPSKSLTSKGDDKDEQNSKASKVNESTTDSSLAKEEKVTVASNTIKPELSKPSIISTTNKSILNTTAASSSSTTVKDNTKRPSLKRHKDSLSECKPLNVLVYAESATSKESAVNTLKEILANNTYTIYPLTAQQVEQKHWLNTTALLVVCGTVPNAIGELFVDYFLQGGKVLSLCSDILHFILPTYRTAEVREHELVQFSYDKWQKVKMMHHIFCYQPSPVKKNFSTDSDDSAYTNSRKPALVCPPRSIELKDLKGDMHQLDVKVLGTEETWNTPSLLLANNKKSGGTAVFSQVHLEINPAEFEADENKFSILKQNDNIRHEIFTDLLKNYLSLSVQENNSMNTNGSGPKIIFKNAYFLGRHEAKFELLEKLKSSVNADNVLVTPELTMKFCGPDDKLPKINSNILPILIHSCPEDFSTVDYFENLTTNYIGRLVIYTPIVNSSQHVISHLELTNGIAVISREQTGGVGRSNNQWLSPSGCAMFSIQLHVAIGSPLGQRLPLIQHIVGAAMITTLKNHSLYKILNLALKWPNDTYANGINKIGGLVVKTTIMGKNAIVNIGCGINLDNRKPTICINDMISDYNNANQQNLPAIKYEMLLALMFNEIERLIELVQTGDFESFYKLYYDTWLHSNQSISICDAMGCKKEAKVIGIDDYGYLKVQLKNGVIEAVQPDGNSFDMLKGLVIPKFN